MGRFTNNLIFKNVLRLYPVRFLDKEKPLSWTSEILDPEIDPPSRLFAIFPWDNTVDSLHQHRLHW